MSEFVALLLAAGHGVAAAAVTLHVLLTHRDVRSSIGWIGMAWLSPYIGAAIYFAFGINRTARRGSQIHTGLSTGDLAFKAATVLDPDVPENIMTLERSNANATGLPVTGGNTLELLRDGNEAYPRMLAAIREARTSVALASYIFDNDKSGNRFTEALIDAHERGVAVRVLIDGIGSGYFYSAVVRRLLEAGVPAARFLHEWLPWQMPFINLRNHKKILVVDGAVGFTGGINISDHNVSGEWPLTVRDTHARVEGPIVRHLMHTFARDWEFTTAEVLRDTCWWPELEPSGTVEMRGITSGPDENVGRIEGVWSVAIERARERIRIVTPYFLPEDRLLELMQRAVHRGVEIEILVPERSNHFYVNWAMRAHLEALPLDKVACYLTPDPFDHSKLMTVDGRWSSIGSPNWDARSMRLNFEFLLECYDEEATAGIDALIDRKMIGARRLVWDELRQRPLWVKLRDASARLLLPYI